MLALFLLNKNYSSSSDVKGSRHSRGVAKDWMGGKREKEGKEDGTGRQEKGNWHPLIRYPV